MVIFPPVMHLVLEDRRISAKSITEQLDISLEQVGSIIHENLDMQKLSAKWVLKCLMQIKTFNGASCLSNF
jgi:hypothetical protein